MSKGSTLYRFEVNLSDVDRNLYEAFDFRVAMHASESDEYLVTRVLAYILNYADGLEFSQGIAEPDEPAIRIRNGQGGFREWIDIGNPTARRMHKASKASDRVRIYTYKDPENLKREAAGESVHRAAEIEIYAFDSRFLKALAATLDRDNRWDVIQNEGELIVTVAEEPHLTQIRAHRLA